MTVFRTLVSGSSGNAVLFSSGSTNILIDCGLNGKTAEGLIRNAGVMPEKINCILVTHEHSDHTAGVGVMSRRYNIPVAASRGTWEGMNIGNICPDNRIEFSKNELLLFGGVSVLPFSIPHDANMPNGYKIICEDRCYAVATDMGHIDGEVMHALSGCRSVVLEANYDNDMLASGPYPVFLKKRIAGAYGHLCNGDTAKLAAFLVKNGTKKITLGHLSNENNTHEMAYHTVASNLEYDGYVIGRDVLMSVAPRYSPSVNIG